MVRVLVVDDDARTRETLSLVLRLSRIDVLTAESSGHALDCVQHHQIDLILSDLRLPDSSGLESFVTCGRTPTRYRS